MNAIHRTNADEMAPLTDSDVRLALLLEKEKDEHARQKLGGRVAVDFVNDQPLVPPSSSVTRLPPDAMMNDLMIDLTGTEEGAQGQSSEEKRELKTTPHQYNIKKSNLGTNSKKRRRSEDDDVEHHSVASS